ncbi:DUF4307 domain-containing protein [Ornithinimicrobium sediminis]|uniref:DUF4307 domain-containing protein n=1 Tax=Ornithinimicrobium sediminis TaxID=2904603 RepID=UPI001E63601B|nr:DUF4307 domain-containing protein [Ornithinimicrobium sediminis]MCE0485625.1 DUF4307 domain-containing protein [Ornithinimicrobium sediminis]
MSSPTATPETSRRTWWVVGVVGVLVMSAVAVWFALSATSGRVHWVNTGFVVAGPDQVDVRFDLRRDPSRSVVCTIEAQDERHGVVGRTETTVEPAQVSPSRHVATVRTAGPAVTGYVDSCRYLDASP